MKYLHFLIYNYKKRDFWEHHSQEWQQNAQGFILSNIKICSVIF